MNQKTTPRNLQYKTTQLTKTSLHCGANKMFLKTAETVNFQRQQKQSIFLHTTLKLTRSEHSNI